MENTKDKLIDALMEVLQLDIIPILKQFIEGEISVLFLLYKKNTPLPPTMIAKYLNISKGRVTALMNSLKKKEYIQILLSDEDRRRFNISITETGKLVLKDKIKLADEYFEMMLSKIGEEKSNNLIDIIKEVVYVMKE